MACTPTRLELSNTDATTVNVTVSVDPGDGTSVVLEVPSLSISETDTTVGGSCSYTIAARTEPTNTLWDGTLQVGTNAPADIVVRIVETSAAQTIGLTISDADVTYCAPTAGAGDATSLTGPVLFVGKNASGGTLTKGTVVYISGISGNTPTVAPADADDSAKMPAFGLVYEDSSDNTPCTVVTFGDLAGIDTSTFTLDQPVYVSTTAGALTATAPTGESALIQNIGLVTRVHASAGSVKVGGAGRSNATPNLNSGNIFYGNGSNQAVSTALTSVAATAAQGALADSALQDVVDDTTPQLGGNLDVNGQSIVSASAGNILITPDTTGKIVLDGLSWPTADGTANQVIQTDGLGQLSFATASGGGDTDFTDRPRSTGGYVKLWYDFWNVTPDRVSPNISTNWWLGTGGSGANIEESTIAGLRGGGQITINANSDRYMIWGPQIFSAANAADGDELLWEARIYVQDSLGTSGEAGIGLAEQTGALNYNDQPYMCDLNSFDGVALVADLSQTYLRYGVKDTGTLATGTITDLTLRPLSSYVDTWMRFGIRAVYNSTSTEWDITFYINGTSVGTESMPFASHIIPHVTAGVGTVSGNWILHMDWISCQYKIGGADTGRITHMTLADL